MNYSLMFDVGGTQVKAGAADASGTLLCVRHFDARAQEGADVILQNFADIAEEIRKELHIEPREIIRIGMAFPGPFDYQNGISRIQGLNKYEAIYGLPLAAEIGKRFRAIPADIPFHFLHDVEAFALGECSMGQARTAPKTCCLCIGTGAGSAFTREKQVLKKPEGIIPENGWIYHRPFRESIIDDYISVRGLERLAAAICGEELDGYQLYQRAVQGDEKAMQTFTVFGADVKAAMEPYLAAFAPDALVLGGQISKSFCWFGKELEAFCSSKGIAIYLVQDTTASILSGLLYHMEQSVV